MGVDKKRTWQQRRDDALSIWQAGVDAVRSDRLVLDNVHIDGQFLVIADESIDLRAVRRIVVVGAGKAGAGMAAGLEQALGSRLLAEKHVSGWINVPADCIVPLQRIHLHTARPAGVNEPRPEGVAGAEAILRLVSQAHSSDLCICLLSGGGSALLPAPVEGITLDDKLAVTRWLSSAGANIQQLNAVRKPLSRIKGGGLARACNAGRLVSLIISDVLGDPLNVIASGPTVDQSPQASEALEVIRKFDPSLQEIPRSVIEFLASQRSSAGQTLATTARPLGAALRNIVIGNNAVAVDAAGMMAEQLGYSHAMESAPTSEGAAEDAGRRLARMGQHMRSHAGPDCLVSGGEPTVRLADVSIRGKGGRNQQLALAALMELAKSHADGVTILSAGTDGEDGPTDAAGALVDEQIVAALQDHSIEAGDFLARNDAYSLFDRLASLVRTGPTHTNVCDLRVALVDRRELEAATPRAD